MRVIESDLMHFLGHVLGIPPVGLGCSLTGHSQGDQSMPAFRGRTASARSETSHTRSVLACVSCAMCVMSPARKCYTHYQAHAGDQVAAFFGAGAIGLKHLLPATRNGRKGCSDRICAHHLWLTSRV